MRRVLTLITATALAGSAHAATTAVPEFPPAIQVTILERGTLAQNKGTAGVPLAALPVLEAYKAELGRDFRHVVRFVGEPLLVLPREANLA